MPFIRYLDGVDALYRQDEYKNHVDLAGGGGELEGCDAEVVVEFGIVEDWLVEEDDDGFVAEDGVDAATPVLGEGAEEVFGCCVAGQGPKSPSREMNRSLLWLRWFLAPSSLHHTLITGTHVYRSVSLGGGSTFCDYTSYYLTNIGLVIGEQIPFDYC